MTLDRSFSKERTMYERWDETGDGRRTIINDAFDAVLESLADNCPDMMFPTDDQAENLVSAITRFYNAGWVTPPTRIEKIRAKMQASKDPHLMEAERSLSDDQLKRLGDIIGDAS